MLILQQVDLHITNVHYFLVELDGHNEEKDEQVRAHLRANGFARDIDTKQGCCAGCDCASNELWVQSRFRARKEERGGAAHSRQRRYNYGTGVKCGVA